MSKKQVRSYPSEGDRVLFLRGGAVSSDAIMGHVVGITLNTVTVYYCYQHYFFDKSLFNENHEKISDKVVLWRIETSPQLSLKL